MTAQPPGGGDLPPRPPMPPAPDSDGAPPPPYPGYPPQQQPAEQYPGGEQFPGAEQHPAGPGGYPAGPPAPWGQARPPMDPISIVAFVCGVLGVLVVTVPVAIVLGIAGIVRTKGKRRRGRIFAVLGILAALLWTGAIAAIVAIVVAAQVDRDDSGNVTEQTTMNVFDVESGDCLRSFDIDDEQQVDVLPCAEPHGAQVITQFDLPAGDWPGNDELAKQAEAGCRDRVAGVLGARVDQGDLGLGYFHPEESSWDAGDRAVLCLVTAQDGGQLTETFNSAD